MYCNNSCDSSDKSKPCLEAVHFAVAISKLTALTYFMLVILFERLYN